MAILKRSNGRGIKQFICLAAIVLPGATTLLAQNAGGGLHEWQEVSHHILIRQELETEFRFPNDPFTAGLQVD
jgi:hypothetical protein